MVLAVVTAAYREDFDVVDVDLGLYGSFDCEADKQHLPRWSAARLNSLNSQDVYTYSAAAAVPFLTAAGKQ